MVIYLTITKVAAKTFILEENAIFDFGITAGANTTSILFKGKAENYNQLKFNASTGGNIGLTAICSLCATRNCKWIRHSSHCKCQL
jgi:hypothetical protein